MTAPTPDPAPVPRCSLCGRPLHRTAKGAGAWVCPLCDRNVPYNRVGGV